MLGGGPRSGLRSRDVWRKLIAPELDALDENESDGSAGRSRAPPDIFLALFHPRSSGGYNASLSSGAGGKAEAERGVLERGGKTKDVCFAVRTSSGGVGAVGLRGLPLVLRGVCGVSNGGASDMVGSTVGNCNVLIGGGASRSSPNIL